MLSRAGVQRIVDIRLNNVSQLAGFAKRDDLRFFSKPSAAPTTCTGSNSPPPKSSSMPSARAAATGRPTKEISWKLIAQRQIERLVPKDLIHRSCLLCSEETPQFCHRRLVAEYLADQWGNVEIIHLV